MFDCQTSFCYFTVRLKSWESEREWNLRKLSSISAHSPNHKTGDKICWTGFTEEYASTPQYAATKYCAGSQRLVFPWYHLLSSHTNCVKPVHNMISCRSVSCAAYKFGLITLQWSLLDRCYSCIPPPLWSTYWWFTDCLHSFHSSVLWPFPSGSIRQPESGGLHSGAPPPLPSMSIT